MINKHLFTQTLLAATVVYALSFLGFHSHTIELLSFAGFLFLTAFFTLKNPHNGILIILFELLISSQGHLFDVVINGVTISLRMGIFAAVLIIWIVKILPRRSRYDKKVAIYVKPYWQYVLLGLFFVWGSLNALLQKNSLSFAYQDLNGYLYFALLPFFIYATDTSLQSAKEQRKNIISVWAGGLTFQLIILLLLLFFYGHVDIFWKMLDPLYRWFRDLRIIEVGKYMLNFHRVFMQSSILAVTGFFVFISLYLKEKGEEKSLPALERFKRWLKRFTNIKQSIRVMKSFFTSLPGILTAAITIIMVSLSRSFWIASFTAFVILFLWYILAYRIKPARMCLIICNLCVMTIISLAYITLMLVVPISTVPGLKSLSSLTQRATQTQNDAALSSRWELLPAVWTEIKQKPIMGNGFGNTVTYITADPRYLEAHFNNPSYTTFAFEWGWLDLWHEMGIGGVIAYASIIFSLLYRGAKHTRDPLILGLTAGVFAIAIIHIFTPFLNHPLGIAHLLLTESFLRKK